MPGRRGRRGTVCAAPVVLEAGWKAKVVQKSLGEKAIIFDIIKQNILFAGLDHSDQSVIVDAMEEKKFNADDVIIKQGAVGDFFYVLESGSCDIFVEGAGKVATVTNGGSFGELALMYNAPRAATVIATEPCKTWAVDQVTFKKTLMATTMKKRTQHEEFIKKVAILGTLNQYERLTIADALQPVNVKAGDVVINEGDGGDSFYIVEEGELKVTKAGVAAEVSDRLVSGSYFGERALITNEKRAATVTAVKDCVLQALDRATFKRLLGPVQDIMVKNMEVYNRYKDSVARAGKEEEDEDEDDEGKDEDDEEEGKDDEGDSKEGESKTGGAGGAAGASAGTKHVYC